MNVETVGVIVGSLSVVAAISGLLLMAFIFYRVREDINTLNQLRRRQEQFEERLRRSSTISNELVNVLYDLYSMSAGYKAISELQSMGMEVDNALFDALNDDFNLAEKHLSELGLFSAEADRRISVAQSLANNHGDLETYTLLSELENGQFGEKHLELKPYREMLADRLGRLIMSVKKPISPSDIRTDGGAF